MKVQLHSFLSSAVNGYEWSTSRPDRFTPGKEHRGPLNKWLDGPAKKFWTVWKWIQTKKYLRVQKFLDEMLKKILKNMREEKNMRGRERTKIRFLGVPQYTHFLLFRQAAWNCYWSLFTCLADHVSRDLVNTTALLDERPTVATTHSNAILLYSSVLKWGSYQKGNCNCVLSSVPVVVYLSLVLKRTVMPKTD